MTYALIIEDDPDAAEVADGMLRAIGYETDIARDGHAALYALSDRPPALILLDICLPEMDGVTLMKVARRVEETQRTPVVACSAIYPPNSATAKILRNLGVTSYLSKPFNLAALRSAVKMAHPTGPAGSASTSISTRPATRAPTAPDEDENEDANLDTATLILRLEDVVARVAIQGREVPMLVERAGDEFFAIRGEAVLAQGDEVRATVKIRRAVNDAMQEFEIRLMGIVEEMHSSPRGERYRIKPRFCNPTYGLKLIAEELARQ